MTVPNVKANGDDQTENVVGSYGIRIKQSAGVTNAASGGGKDRHVGGECTQYRRRCQ